MIRIKKIFHVIYNNEHDFDIFAKQIKSPFLKVLRAWNFKNNK